MSNATQKQINLINDLNAKLKIPDEASKVIDAIKFKVKWQQDWGYGEEDFDVTDAKIRKYNKKIIKYYPDMNTQDFPYYRIEIGSPVYHILKTNQANYSQIIEKAHIALIELNTRF